MAQEMRIVLQNRDKIDPLKINDYISTGGYKSLEKARGMKPTEIIEEVKKSGLRGRGGAGFNTGLKWSFSHNIQSDEKYVICNADEGEPGTYKDRIIFESDPHIVLEGMAICGYAIGAKKGYIYCRGEYPYIVDLLKTAIKQAKDAGVLGEFDIEVRMGAGAYVCGEESALIESIQGQRGEPRFKPPFPPVSGLNWKPTIVNNVETFASIPAILERGAEWFSGIGAKNYPGTKVLSLTGADEVMQAIKDEIEKRHLTDVDVSPTGCIGLCVQEPLVEVMIPGKEKVVFCQMDAAKGRQIVEQYLVNGIVNRDWVVNL
jgi:NADH:ubiquinone oxidoreductase subunit F (NADH-binding)/(2Fe-2S) ferredoxin